MKEGINEHEPKNPLMDFGCSVGIFRVPYKRRRNVNTKTCKKNVNRFWVLKENFCLNPIRYNTVAKKKTTKNSEIEKEKNRNL